MRRPSPQFAKRIRRKKKRKKKEKEKKKIIHKIKRTLAIAHPDPRVLRRRIVAIPTRLLGAVGKAREKRVCIRDATVARLRADDVKITAIS
jgi:hypothetical protein